MISQRFPFLSVIIPVYNVDSYLPECLDHVLNQTFTDFEIIAVDDGSTDSSPDILLTYAKKDERLNVISQENRGLSEARNTGLRAARGEYVVFLDSDDYWGESDELTTLVEELVNGHVDLLFFDLIDFYLDGRREHLAHGRLDPTYLKGVSVSDAFIYMVRQSAVKPSACTLIARREFLQSSGLYFKPDIYSEDIEWFLRLVLQPGVCSYLPVPLYWHRADRPDSISNKVGVKNVSDLLATLASATNRINRHSTSPEFVEAYLSYCAYQYTIALAFIGTMSRKDRRQLVGSAQDLSLLLKHTGYSHIRYVAFLSRVLGFNITIRVLGLYLTLHRDPTTQRLLRHFGNLRPRRLGPG